MLYISMNTEGDIEEQTSWLEQVLEKHPQKWIIVSMHRGVYGGSRFNEADDGCNYLINMVFNLCYKDITTNTREVIL